MIESVLTFFLVWVIFATAADPRGAFSSISGLAIGFTITLDIFMGGPYTGAAMNPARALGPQLVQNVWTNAWVWYVGPAIGRSRPRTSTTTSTCGRPHPSRSGHPRLGSKSRARGRRR